MDPVKIGTSFRAVRIKLRMRQEDVAARAAVHRSTISLIERGHWESLSFKVVARVAAVLQMGLDVVARWRGGELDRLVNAGHSRMHEVVAEMFDGLPEWITQPEVSFAIFRERGIIDILAFHAPSGSLLVIELKTEIVDVQALVGGVDVKARLALRVARDRGWPAKSVSVWVAVAESRTNRRRLAAHRSMLRAAFPDDGRQMRTWLRKPTGVRRVLSFVTSAHGGSAGQKWAPVKRVRRTTRRLSSAETLTAAGGGVRG